MFSIHFLRRLKIGNGLRCLSSRSSVPHVAVIGSGPGGFYSAQHILKVNNLIFLWPSQATNSTRISKCICNLICEQKLGSEVRVDIFEKDPIPFGLVRYGVAPDHPEVKVNMSNIKLTFINY